jgi:hypothetical protein
MKLKWMDNQLVLSGSLNEAVDFDYIKSELIEFQKIHPSKTLKINFSEVKLANSIGISNWINTVAAIDTVLICYTMAPKWLVAQFNMLPEFFCSRAVVESVEVPYYSEERDQEITKVLQLGRDFDLREEPYSMEDFPNIELEGAIYEIDVLPRKYFKFINENFNKISEILK